MKTYFDDTQITLLALAGMFFVLSLIFQITKRNNFSIVFLGLSAICVFSFAAVLDPFLNSWDERFHALVAKNMMSDPFKPTLYYDPIVNMAYDRWDRYHIWLHKQPLFLWQIALSFKMFGLSEFALRLPNIILGTILVLITYRSGKLLVNPLVGFIAGTLTMSNIYILEMIAGRQELEHNDFTFLVYISLSIWCFIEYFYSKNKIWIYLIGLFSGMAILCKWLVGLLVYFGWFVLKVLQRETNLSSNKDLLLSLLITIIIAAPWQIFTFIYYPVEAASAYKFNVQHVTIPLEGHGGNWWYHFDTFNFIYGWMASFLIIPSFYILLKKCNDQKLLYSLLSMIMIVYLFFAFVATKMPSFTTVLAMIIFIAFAALIHQILDYKDEYIVKNYARNSLFACFIIAIVLLRFDIEFFQEKHTTWKEENQYTRALIHNKKVFKSLGLPQNTVLFNIKDKYYIDAMFYTGLPAYNFIPTVEQYNDLIAKGRNILIFHPKGTSLPDYLKNAPSVMLIHEELLG